MRGPMVLKGRMIVKGKPYDMVLDTRGTLGAPVASFKMDGSELAIRALGTESRIPKGELTAIVKELERVDDAKVFIPNVPVTTPNADPAKSVTQPTTFTFERADK